MGIRQVGDIFLSIMGKIHPNYNYLLHHAFYWIGRWMMLKRNYLDAKTYLALSKQYGTCELHKIKKVSKWLTEI